jgi:hypothetical protein
MDLTLFLVRLCCQNYCGLCFTCESWDTKLEERVEALPCEERLELLFTRRFLVCGPFVARGDKGEEEYP